MKSTRIVRAVLWIAVLSLSAAMLKDPTPLLGQTTQPSDKSVGSIELDIEALLTSPRVLPPAVQDFVWRVNASNQSRFLVMVPFKIKPGEGDLVLDRRSVAMKGPRAQFVAWHLVSYDEDAQVAEMGSSRGSAGVSTIDTSRDRRAGRAQAAGRMGPMPGGGGPGMMPGGGAGMAPGGGPGMAPGGGPGMAPGGGPGMMSGGRAGTTGAASYEGIRSEPKFAYTVTVTPHDTMKWKMERRIRGAEVMNNGQLYSLKIDNQLLNERNPDADARSTGQSGRGGGPGGPGGMGSPSGVGGRGNSRSGTSGRNNSRSGTSGRSNSRGSSRGSSRGAPGGTRGGAPGGGINRGGAGQGGNDPASREAAAAAEEVRRIQERMARENFRELRQEVRELPTEFEESLPSRIWGIFEMSIAAKEFKIVSAAHPNLNWKVGLEQLHMLRNLAQFGVQTVEDQTGRLTIPPQTRQQFTQLSRLVDNDDPISLRAVAHATHLAHLGHYTQVGDQLFDIFQRLLKSSDTQAQETAQEELFKTFPPNLATATLLKEVAKSSLDPKAKARAITSVLMVSARQLENPLRAQETLNTANQALSDAKGPPPGTVLGAMVEATRDKDQAIVFSLVSGIKFQSLTEERLQQVMVYVVENAGREPLAAAWLDKKFLSATDPDLVKNTLQVIVDAEAGAQSLGPAIQWSMARIFGTPDDAKPSVKAKIAYKIPIDSVQHGLIRALQHGDGKIRALAWDALPNFKLPPEPVYEGADQFGMQSDPQSDRYRVLIDAALEQSPTPTQIVPFLATQPELIDRDVAGNARDQRKRQSTRRSNRGARRQDNRTANRGRGGGAPMPGGAGRMGGAPAMMPGGAPGIMPRGGAPDPGRRGGGQMWQGAGTQMKERQFGPGEHPDILKAVNGLVQIVLRGSSSASSAASRALLGSNWPIDATLADLEFGERQGFAMRTYENLTGRVPWVTNVLRQRLDRNPVLVWFGYELADGNLPDPSAWIDAFRGGEEELLGLSVANDSELAKGVVAVLVSSAGGQDRTAQQLFAKIRQLPDQSTENVSKLWQEQRREILAQRIRRMEGPYRLVLRVSGTITGSSSTSRGDDEPPRGREAERMARPPSGPMVLGGRPGGGPRQQGKKPKLKLPDTFDQEIILGVVQLKVNGQDISFGNQNVSVKLHDSKLAIVIEKPSELVNFENEQLSQLPLEKAKQPTTLTPQVDGNWVGMFSLSGADMFIFLEPASEA